MIATAKEDYNRLTSRLEELEQQETSLLIRSESAIGVITKAIQVLKAIVKEKGYPDEATEIRMNKENNRLTAFRSRLQSRWYPKKHNENFTIMNYTSWKIFSASTGSLSVITAPVKHSTTANTLHGNRNGLAYYRMFPFRSGKNLFVLLMHIKLLCCTAWSG